MRGGEVRGAGVRGCVGAMVLGAVVLGALVLGARRAEAQTPVTMPVTMEQAVRAAIERHPAIREASARVDEARGLAQQAGTAANPAIGYLVDDLGTGNGSPAGKHGAFIEMPIALGGRLGAARAAGDALVAARGASLDVVRRQVIAEARARWLAAAMAARRLDVHESLATLAEESIDIAGKLFNVGLVDRADILDAEAAAAEARAHRGEAASALDAAWEQLAGIMGEPSLVRTRAPELPDLPALNRAEARARLLAESPVIEAARLEVERQRALVVSAQKMAWPDLTLKAAGWFDRERRQGTATAKGWGFGAEAGFRLPLFDRRAGHVLAATANVRVAEAALQRIEEAVHDDFSRAWAGYSGAVARVAAIRDDVLPRAEAAHQMYLEDFQQMSSPYPHVLTARERLIRSRLALSEALEEAWLSWIRIDIGFESLCSICPTLGKS
jgi:cobalt-zinc-cadmium efflux system outer membrane protein